MASAPKMIKLRQTGSALRRPPIQRATLKGLGLGRVGAQRELVDNQAVRGMIDKVRHLLEVSE